MLLMLEKWIRVGIYHSISRYAKANNKYTKDYDHYKKKESLYFNYWDILVTKRYLKLLGWRNILI